MCLAPVPMKVGEHVIRRSCGQCTPCRIRYKRKWIGRLLGEASTHLHNSFLTLTYADRELSLALDYSHIQLALKRLRKEGPFRFYAVGEYGERFGCGHWHLLIFGRAFAPGLATYDWWPYGQTFAGSIAPASCGYVAGYGLKGLGDSRLPFARMSRRPGIGARAAFQAGLMAAESGALPPDTLVFDGKSYAFDQFMSDACMFAYRRAGGRFTVSSPSHLELATRRELELLSPAEFAPEQLRLDNEIGQFRDDLTERMKANGL